MYLCTCNNCGKIYYDTNPQPAESHNYIWSKEEFTHIHIEELEGHACPDCGCDDYLVDNINDYALCDNSRELLGMLVDVNNECENIITGTYTPTSVIGIEIHPQMENICHYLASNYPHNFIIPEFKEWAISTFLKWYNTPELHKQY